MSGFHPIWKLKWRFGVFGTSVQKLTWRQPKAIFAIFCFPTIPFFFPAYPQKGVISSKKYLVEACCGGGGEGVERWGGVWNYRCGWEPEQWFRLRRAGSIFKVFRTPSPTATEFTAPQGDFFSPVYIVAISKMLRIALYCVCSRWDTVHVV
jgi:hypothetical protein